MQIRPVEHSSLYCLFAEDQRLEADGKSTVIGWMPDNAVIALPPEGNAVIPKLSVIAILVVPFGTPADELDFSLFLNETLLHSSKMTRSQVEEVTTAQASDDLETPRAGVFRMALSAQNLVISEAGYLRVQVTLGNLKLTSNGLKFAVQPSDASPAAD